MASLFDSVTILPGIGPTRAQQLAKLGIHTLYDLIAYFPRDYEDRTRLRAIADLQVDQPACFEAIVISHPRTAHIRQGLDLTKVTLADQTARLSVTFFNQRYIADHLHYGQTYIFYGKLEGDAYGAQMTNPVFEPLESPGVMTRRILPVYSLTAGITNKMLVKAIEGALHACRDSLPEVLPHWVRQRFHLCDAAYAYETIHHPADFDALAVAQKRLIFEEFFVFSVGLAMMRARRQKFP